MKYEIRTNVLNGNLKRNRNLILNALETFEGQEVILTIQKARKSRSNPQNAYYWSCLIPITQQAVKNEWGEIWTKELCHEFYKAKFLYHEKVNEVTGEIAKIPKSTTENTTTEQENYHTDIRTFLKEWFNVDAPLPNENILLDFKD
jgi:hypothetical protein